MSQTQKVMDFVSEKWDREIVPQLSTYIKIPNKSPMFDPLWSERGYMDEAMSLIETWVRDQPVAGMRVERIQLAGRTPLLYIDIPGKGDETVMLYGHMDKQPEMLGWNVDLAPWTPVLSGDKLYGRGGADDGYAAFASLTAIMALKDRGLDHSRCVVLIFFERSPVSDPSTTMPTRNTGISSQLFVTAYPIRNPMPMIEEKRTLMAVFMKIWVSVRTFCSTDRVSPLRVSSNSL